MQQTFYFYDLETTGFSARNARIMQFAGQRTDMDLKPIGEPDNILIKLTPDVLPDPDAIMVTGITPQKTLTDGITEAEFLCYFYDKIAQPNTIFVGYNTVRFDDEFIRFTNYRNFYDAYEWQWQDGRSKWDMLDVVRMTRALRPDGIKWPFGSDGKPVNKLEPIAAINKLNHEKAHDALSDVYATIAIAKLIKTKQPKLFDYLLNMRDKRKVEDLVGTGEPFVYTSGKYNSDFAKTTIAVSVAQHPSQKGTVLVYDLRIDPEPFAKMPAKELAVLLQKFRFEENELRLPVKRLQSNRCPAVAPMTVLTVDDKDRLQIDDAVIKANFEKLRSLSDFGDRLQEAIRLNEKARQSSLVVDVQDVDTQLYDGFFGDSDKTKMRVVRAANENELADLNLDFADKRLELLLLLYKARQFPKSLTADEQTAWQSYRTQKLLSGDADSQIAKYFNRINELSVRTDLNQDQLYALEELKLYGESIMPYDS